MLKLASVEGYPMEEARRDGEMWVSMLLLGAAEHPVSQLLGLHSVPLLPCGCQLHVFFCKKKKKEKVVMRLFIVTMPV